MNVKKVYIALSQFCDDDETPRRVLVDAGVEVRENQSGKRLRPEEIRKEVAGADAVIAGVELYDSDTLSALPGLRCISRCGVGTDSIDLEAARRLGIAVRNTPEEVVEPVAHVTLAMILALARNFPVYIAESRAHQWKRHSGYLLSEWTIGLVGFGRIARAVEKYLRPFGSTILVADPNIGSIDVPANVKLCDLATLLGSADVVSLHVSRPSAEGALLGPDQFALMKKGSRIINTSRGHLIDETALLGALVSGHISGAALDVFEAEPYSGPLADLPQVLCTPHISSLTNASRRAMELRAVMNVIDFLGQPG